MKNRVIIFGLGLLYLLFTSTAIFSQNSEDKTLSPYFFVKSDDQSVDQMPLKKTSGEVRIVGMIADVSVSQVYENTGQATLEAIYVFPASTRAAVYAVEMRIGDRLITAEIEEKKKAREKYEAAKEAGKRASLLEQNRPNVFKMNVANIRPGDKIEVVLKYTEMLIPEKGIYEFVYPTVVGPRYTGGSDPTDENNQFANTPYQQEGELPFYEFGLDLAITSGMPIQSVDCQTHEVIVNHPDLHNALVSLSPAESDGGNRDFVLRYQLAGNEIESGVMLYEHEDENFFMAMIQPPKKIRETDIPPREYIFIVDVSGSMRGYPLDVSKKLMRNLVVNLKPTDRFNVLLFAGTSGWLSSAPLPANQSNVARAIDFIDNQTGGGGTNLLPALQKAMSMPRFDEKLSRSLVIVTDGYVTIEKEAFNLIREQANQSNVFAFGIGNGVNRFLIEGLAFVGQGEPFVVMEPGEAAQTAERFREYINRPVLTQVEIDFGKMEVYDIEPKVVADVLAERPILVTGKYKGDLEGDIVVKGFTGSKRYKAALDLSEATPDKRNQAIRYLWARERIRILDDFNRLRSDSEIIAEVTALGLKYNLLTAYTSFIAVEETEVVNDDGQIVTVKQPVPLPKGVSNHAVGFDYDMDVKANNFEFSESETFGSMPTKIVMTDLNFDQEKEVIKYFIQANLESSLLACEQPEIMVPDEIILKISADGKVLEVQFIGPDVSEKTKACLRTKLMQWNFGKLGIQQTWHLTILN